MLKSPLLIAGAMAIGGCLWHPGWRRGPPAVNLLVTTAAFALLWGGFTSMKVGASENYYMVQTAFSFLLALAFFPPEALAGAVQRVRLSVWTVLLFAQTAACLMVLLGARGRIDIRQDELPTLALKAKLAGLAGPILVAERYYNLPWINPAAPRFVYAYVYRTGPLKVRHYEDGGLEGLVRQGYFKRIILSKKNPAPEWLHLNGGYAYYGEDAWFTYYRPAASADHE